MAKENLPFPQLSIHIRSAERAESDWIAVQACNREKSIEVGLVLDGKSGSILLEENEVKALIGALKLAKNFIKDGEQL
ncbi:MAG: hypothetical protein COW76_20400 [Shewanella sp. CG18_big_fil_WC_8_21_14_2_50_42_11]|uniref:hypothetical protein n=1 Tax=Shewanella sp. CG18_big_fil_WC_8_21_14_2_50_42_11 TaxID=1975538 RepID=UPI000C38E029|nr:hypothetical protein [Shewanella sp. CG18_big_fil_WC_8_21_14_2_50_42_11]PIP98525.1 MAG: hypothetical protein COW76_20400 [Shewanella sp. CG18_big_fil_WC_8_21_14_2_50_42_11]